MSEWRPVAGHEGYEVSDRGCVRSVERNVVCNRGSRTVKPRLLRQYQLSTGYLQVTLTKRRKQSVHRIVALAFLGDAPNGCVVNHKNGNKCDNSIENLEWCTPSENIKHGFRVLHPDVRPFLGKFSSEHPTSKPVISVDMTTGAEKFYPSAMDAVREGFDSSSISRCCSGKIRFHKGRLWRFSAAQAGVYIPREEL